MHFTHEPHTFLKIRKVSINPRPGINIAPGRRETHSGADNSESHRCGKTFTCCPSTRPPYTGLHLHHAYASVTVLNLIKMMI